MPKYFRNCISPVFSIFAFCLLFASSNAAPALNDIPIPQETLVVAWLRPALIAGDPQLKSLTSDLGIVYQNLQAMGISPANIDEAVLFGPFNLAWVYGSGHGFPQNLPSNGAMVLKGKFNVDTKYRDLKTKGWKENHFDKKKVLFWTVSETFLCSPDGNACTAVLKGDRLVVGGSPEIVKIVLNVAEGKTPSLASDPIYQQMDKHFTGNGNIAISLYAILTDQMRALIKPPPLQYDTATASSKAAATAINTLRSYSSHVKQLGFSISSTGVNYEIGGLLAFDGDNSAALVSTVFQLGGGLVNFLPPGDPVRAVLNGLIVTRDGAIINLQSIMTRQQFSDIFIRRR